jgi:DNA-binding GntR family transcriptional regulator
VSDTVAAVPQTTQQHAVDWLRRAIVTRALRPGDRVGQEEIAARIGASIVPVREALRTLQQEGQLTYIPRRGYFVTRLEVADVVEIYALREILEERAARLALPFLREERIERLRRAAAECAAAAAGDEVAAELEANRRFHFEILDAPGHSHQLKLIRLLWSSTEAYRALYYNLPGERRATIEAHEQIIAAVLERDADRLVAELNAHRRRALVVLEGILGGSPPSPEASQTAPR